MFHLGIFENHIKGPLNNGIYPSMGLAIWDCESLALGAAMVRTQGSSDGISNLICNLCGWEQCERCTYPNLMGHSSWYPLRTLSKAMMKRMDLDYVKKNGELWPGGDVRIMGNQWLRSAYVDSSLSKVPRENTFRACVRKIVQRNHLRSLLSTGVTCQNHNTNFMTA